MQAAVRRLTRAIEQVQIGDLDGALSTATAVVRHNPELVDGHFILGMLCRDKGRLGEALKHLQNAVQSRPQNAAYVDALGTVHLASGRPEEAHAAFERALHLEPERPESLFNLGCARLRLGWYAAAKETLARLVQLQPRDNEAWLELGVAEARLGNLDQGMMAFHRSIELNPKNGLAWMNLGSLLAQLGHRDEPLRCYRRACALLPDHHSSLERLGWYLSHDGKYAEAREVFEKALALNPRAVSATAGLARLLEIEGRIDEAFDRLLPLVESGAQNERLVTTWASVCIKKGCPHQALSVVESLSQKELPALDEGRIQFALGNLLDSLGENSRAFAAWNRANESQGLVWDVAEARAEVDRILVAWANPSALARATHQDERMVFVLGMPRSGTSLVEQILGCHPQVQATGEREELRQMVFERGTDWPGLLAGSSPGDLDSCAQRYLESVLGSESDALRVTDKMPVNFRYVGWIRQVFPRARIVHLNRHPLDVGLSCLRQHFAGKANAWSMSLEGIAALMDDHDRLMALWRAQGTDDLFELSYEDLVSSPEETVRRLLDFVGLPFHEACLRHHESSRLVNTASYAQVQEPIHGHAIGKWHPYARQLLPLARARNLLEEVEAVINPKEGG